MLKINLSIKELKKIFTILILSILLLSINLVFASEYNGTIDNTFKNGLVCHDPTCTYANSGKINFKPTVGTTSFPQITISDTNGIDGYAWGNEMGWIKFDRATGTSSVTINNNTGQISGYAWSQVSGWINFRPTAPIGTTTSMGLPYGVEINTNGEWQGWAWAGGTYGGWIKFDCSGGATTTCVKTDWRPINNRVACNDGRDNDSDGLIDLADSGCAGSTSGTSESAIVPSGGGGGGGGGGAIVILPSAGSASTTPTTNNLSNFINQNQTLDTTNDLRSDVNDSGKIDIIDFNIMIVNWGKKVDTINKSSEKKDRCPLANRADINCDGVVNILDFNLLLVYWGTTFKR